MDQSHIDVFFASVLWILLQICADYVGDRRVKEDWLLDVLIGWSQTEAGNGRMKRLDVWLMFFCLWWIVFRWPAGVWWASKDRGSSVTQPTPAKTYVCRGSVAPWLSLCSILMLPLSKKTEDLNYLNPYTGFRGENDKQTSWRRQFTHASGPLVRNE